MYNSIPLIGGMGDIELRDYEHYEHYDENTATVMAGLDAFKPH